jgi:hypothetical protein
MSETNTPTPPGEGAPAPAAPAEYIPQDVLRQEDNDDATKPLQQQDGREPAKEAPAADKADAPAETEEDERQREKRREAARIGYLTKQRYAEKARADALEERLRHIEAQQGNGAQQPQLSPQQQQELAQWVEQRAAQKLAEQQASVRFSEWDKGGIKEFGEEKFRDACKTVAEMADNRQREILRDVAMDTEGGARAIIEMAGDAEVAERILALPPHRMALEIAKLGAPRTLAPKAVSSAPPPIRPPAVGRARGEPDPEHGSMEDFMRWSQKANWRR